MHARSDGTHAKKIVANLNAQNDAGVNLPSVRALHSTRPRSPTLRKHLSTLLNIQKRRPIHTRSRVAMSIRRIAESHITKLGERNQRSLSVASDNLKVFDDPLGVGFAERSLTTERMADVLASAEVSDGRRATGRALRFDFHFDLVARVHSDVERVGVFRQPFVPRFVLLLAVFDVPVDAWHVMSAKGLSLFEDELGVPVWRIED